MKVKINDVVMELPDGATLLEALTAANVTPTGIATAVNGTVVPAASREGHILTDGDTVLIIKAFYGG
ncbi:MAG: sulfur carrier protein ThiS [Pseudoflavonifractor sp.]|nr:sulfur carrier protein ThiS [Pseudoflavonifractor sp.]